MSKSKDRAPKEDKVEKKRKRQEETDIAPKKSKKSRKSDVDQDAPVADAPVVESKEERKARKKERREKAAAEAAEDNGAGSVSEDFVPLVNDDVPMPDATDDKKEKKSKKDKKDKKDKKEKSEKKEKKSKKPKDASEADSAPSEEAVAEVEEVNGAEKKKAKKEKKEKKEKKSAEEPAAETNGAEPAEDESAEADAQEDGEEVVEGKKGRFIVFVGNLPYSATKESISEHFAKLNPTEIRLRTYKGNEKFMGTCFIEFDRFDRMETCLKKYHHSVFPDGKKKEGRKINVELSAGGGGNSENRKSRIVAKNDKLHDERARDREKRAELEMKQSERKDKKNAKGKKGEKEEDAEEAQPDNAGMHPARLAMIQGPTHRQRY